jgi:GT2 family glycosyltransferase
MVEALGAERLHNISRRYGVKGALTVRHIPSKHSEMVSHTTPKSPLVGPKYQPVPPAHTTDIATPSVATPSLAIKRRPDGWAIPGNRWDLLDGVWPTTPPSVSVIVLHYRQPSQLARTLRALARQSHPAHRTEILVVDDGSPEPPVVPEGVRLLVQPDLGFRAAAARNLGAAAARNEILVFLDADTAPEPDYLREITRLPALAFDCVTAGRRRHADLAAVPRDAPIEVAGRANELPEPRWLSDAYRASRNLLDTDPRSYRFLIGAVLACSRRFLAETGGFDESFTQYGGEDWEWNYRAWLNGAVFAHAPSAVAWHDGPDSSSRSDSTLAKKNAEALRLAHLIPVPGSRARALPTTRADILVDPPQGPLTPGQRFVTLDSALAELPGPVAVADDSDRGGLDRVRVEVVIERPVRFRPGALAPALAAVTSQNCAEVALTDSRGDPLVRVVSRRAAARQQRWGGDPLALTLELPASPGIEELTGEVDLEAYLGGW